MHTSHTRLCSAATLCAALLLTPALALAQARVVPPHTPALSTSEPAEPDAPAPARPVIVIEAVGRPHDAGHRPRGLDQRVSGPRSASGGATPDGLSHPQDAERGGPDGGVSAPTREVGGAGADARPDSLNMGTHRAATPGTTPPAVCQGGCEFGVPVGSLGLVYVQGFGWVRVRPGIDRLGVPSDSPAVFRSMALTTVQRMREQLRVAAQRPTEAHVALERELLAFDGELRAWAPGSLRGDQVVKRAKMARLLELERRWSALAQPR